LALRAVPMASILAMLAVSASAALVDVSATTISSSIAMTTTPRSKAPCMMCLAGSLKLDVIANQLQDPPGAPPYTCKDAQDWLNAPSTTATCANGRAYWGTTCCTLLTRKFLPPTTTLTATLTTVTYTVTLTMTATTTTVFLPPNITLTTTLTTATYTVTLTMTTTTTTGTTPTEASRAPCVMCLNEGFRRNAIATQPKDPPGTPPYTCKDAQDWLNAPSTTTTCAGGRAYWKTTCCIQKPSQAPSPEPSPAPSPTPSPAPSPSPVDDRVNEEIERVESEIESYIYGRDLDPEHDKFIHLLRHLERVFSRKFDAKAEAKIKEYAIMIALRKHRNKKNNR